MLDEELNRIVDIKTSEKATPMQLDTDKDFDSSSISTGDMENSDESSLEEGAPDAEIPYYSGMNTQVAKRKAVMEENSHTPKKLHVI